LFPAGEATSFRARWTEAQTGFVDEPRTAVEQADGLVAEMMQRLAQVFADERSKLEVQWSRGDDISTEDLRVALRRYPEGLRLPRGLSPARDRGWRLLCRGDLDLGDAENLTNICNDSSHN